MRGKWHFPELVQNAKLFWDKHTQQLDPVGRGDLPARTFFIEDKASGQSLVQTLEGQGIDVEAWTMDEYPDIPADKVARAREASFLIYGRKVWIPSFKEGYPEESIYPWTEQFVDECTAFAEDMSHEHDDQVDALSWLGLTLDNIIEAESAEELEEEEWEEEFGVFLFNEGRCASTGY